jgi:uncharacterized membrane protein
MVYNEKSLIKTSASYKGGFINNKTTCISLSILIICLLIYWYYIDDSKNSIRIENFNNVIEQELYSKLNEENKQKYLNLPLEHKKKIFEKYQLSL